MTDASFVLVADIGGTNVRFALADCTERALLVDGSIHSFPVAGFPSLAHATQHYLSATDTQVKTAVFAAAGRVDNDEVQITNHPWVISRERTRTMLELQQLHLINDFTAQAMAITALTPEDVIPIGAVQWQRPRSQETRTYAVIGPGTGLGISGLLVREGRHYPLETEGGHASFPPSTPTEIRLLEILARQFGRVSNERLICGPGLVNIYRALCEMHDHDPGICTPADITRRALENDSLSAQAVDIFCSVFGALAGDLVLTLGAWDGVFLTGGMAFKMLDFLCHSGFRERFEHKGRFTPTMAKVPALAIIHPNPGLLGAAAYAVEHRIHVKA